MTEATEEKKTKQPPADGPVEVTINVDRHEHAGKVLKKGDKITVTPSERDWLAQHQLIKA